MPTPVYFVLAGIVCAAVVFVLWYQKRCFHLPISASEKRIGKTLLALSKEHDYLCLTHLLLQVDDFFVQVPTLLIGNKYLYYIDPLEMKGSISGKDIDRKWVIKTPKGVQYLDNPIKKSDLIIEVIADFLQVDVTSFINICVFAKGVEMGEFNVTRPNSVVVTEADLVRFIQTSEKESDVFVFQPQDLERVAGQLYTIHQKSIALKKRMKARKEKQ